GTSFAATGQEWFRTASSGKPALTSVFQVDDQLQWVVAAPVTRADGQTEGVVAAKLSVAELAVLLNPELDDGSEVIAVDSSGAVLYESGMGEGNTTAALLL